MHVVFYTILAYLCQAETSIVLMILFAENVTIETIYYISKLEHGGLNVVKFFISPITYDTSLQ